MSRTPDYDVRAMSKSLDDKASIGVAWTNKDGSIGLVLNPFVTLSNVGRDLVITLFPRKEEPSP
jgi:hypothetical protein